MKLGFSLLSLFMKDVNEMLDIAVENGFDSVELLAEGPYRPDEMLGNKEITEVINLASLNPGIRKESVKQTKDCLDLADEIGAIGITAHPGKIGRPEKYLRDMALEFLTETTHELVAYAEDKEAKISIENMPERFSYLGNRAYELENLTNETGCNITIDLGHVNTCEDQESFFKIPNILYNHINDNDGIKDKHQAIGDGTLDLNLLKYVKNGIIELNNFDNVMKSKKVIEDFLSENK
ncbi:sugar phosphate isomerase/epimerase [uncultured Methanobrevibacter sp.]|uniref:sugar phosphate isomerase/epimerase family protein n=1 Tax=uncultured Methanobrevibacter sp. TaxID=253161 RepID=UPI0025F70F74|nr:sugar phosphate isomerase/epimerase [uncultured Methanobrevibacter sp.]